MSRRPSDPLEQETQPTEVAPPLADAPAEPTPAPEALPAGLAPEDVVPSKPSFHDRARLRRRMRYLRSVRELGFRDLGGLVFDLHRFAKRHDELVLAKLSALDAVDRELRAIERVLDERRDIIELREPGIAACPRCGALHGSDARFCPQCGTQLTGPLAMGTAVGGYAPQAAGPVPTTPAEAPTTVAPPQAVPSSPPTSALDQPTSAMPPLPGAEVPPTPEEEVATPPEPEPDEAAAEATEPEASAPEGDAPQPVTGGDPLAQRDRPDS